MSDVAPWTLVALLLISLGFGLGVRQTESELFTDKPVKTCRDATVGGIQMQACWETKRL